jgi:antitoxin HicB
VSYSRFRDEPILVRQNRLVKGFYVMAEQQSYTIQLVPEPEGGFTVLVPALPEVVTYGETEARALEMAQDAILLALRVRREEGDPIPDDVQPVVRTLVVSAAA